METKKFLFSLVFVIGCTSFSFGQEQLENITISANFEKAAPGTFEILPSKMVEAFEEKKWNLILIKIEAKRDDTETVYLKVSEYTTIKIYPRSEL